MILKKFKINYKRLGAEDEKERSCSGVWWLLLYCLSSAAQSPGLSHQEAEGMVVELARPATTVQDFVSTFVSV